ncbi:MAG: Ada metal-binding domain-containing protein [Pyrinomonadaceae bacterium]
MHLKTICALCFFIPFWTCGVTAQETTCTLKLEQLPNAGELRGFRLGMTMDQVKARVPPVVFGRTDQFGLSKTSINPHFDSRFDATSFEGVRTVSFNFLDGRLIELWVGYDAGFKWQKLDEFVAGFGKALGLPGRWQAKGRGQLISCDGVEIFASMVGGSPGLRLTDTVAEHTLTSRREEAANAQEEAEAAEVAFIGDKQTKLYYPPGCAAAKDVSPANRVLFTDVEEAQKAGYKQTRKCQ